MLSPLTIALSPLAILTFSGCSLCTKVEYVDKIKIVKEKVIVRCETPEPQSCNWSTGSDSEVAPKMLECIIEQKKYLNKCKGE